jgi:imidazolonepropionase-like amidohydrolase
MQVPGFSLHRELALLVEGGIPAPDVLRMTTSGAASALRRGDFGTIEPGKRADLLIIDGDPLVDINDSRKIEAVVKAGVAWQPEDLLGRIST